MALPLVASLLAHLAVYSSYQCLSRQSARNDLVRPSSVQLDKIRTPIALVIAMNLGSDAEDSAPDTQPETAEARRESSALVMPEQVLVGDGEFQANESPPPAQPIAVPQIHPIAQRPPPLEIPQPAPKPEPVVQREPEPTGPLAIISPMRSARPEGGRETSPWPADTEPPQPSSTGGVATPGTAAYLTDEPAQLRGGDAPGRAAAANASHSAKLVRPPNLSSYYPYHARTKGITGVTQVELLVDPRGRVAKVKGVSGQPAGIFETAAARVARALEFHPALEGGRPVASEFTVTIEWKLQP